MALVLHGAAWLAFPAIITEATDNYATIAHSIEAGEMPDLGIRGLGYPLFMLACKALPALSHTAKTWAVSV